MTSRRGEASRESEGGMVPMPPRMTMTTAASMTTAAATAAATATATTGVESNRTGEHGQRSNTEEVEVEGMDDYMSVDSDEDDHQEDEGDEYGDL